MVRNKSGPNFLSHCLFAMGKKEKPEDFCFLSRISLTYELSKKVWKKDSNILIGLKISQKKQPLQFTKFKPFTEITWTGVVSFDDVVKVKR